MAKPGTGDPERVVVPRRILSCSFRRNILLGLIETITKKTSGSGMLSHDGTVPAGTAESFQMTTWPGLAAIAATTTKNPEPDISQIRFRTYEC